jgi:hypothetical protein
MQEGPGGENRVIAYISRDPASRIGEQDLFSLEEGELLYFSPKNRGYYPGRLYKQPKARLRRLWVWQETGGVELAGEKKLEDAQQFNIPEYPKVVPLFADSEGKPDVRLVLSMAEVRLEHLAGSSDLAHYRFSIELGLVEPGVGEKLAIFDPDVHDTKGGGG